jgi:xylan 1,4-beta-xylosidase
MATRQNNGATIMVWNYHDDDIAGESENVSIKTRGLPNKTILVHQYRIDKEHSNSYELWKKMGSPQNPSSEQIKALERAGQLQLLGSPKCTGP